MKRAFVVLLFGRVGSAVLSLLAVPIYLRFIGVEAYGVVGLYTSLNGLIFFLDLGLGAVLTRELARMPGNQEGLSSGCDITRTFETISVLVAVLIGLFVFASSPLLAQHWLRIQTLSRAEVTNALMLAGMALACQWPANLYQAGLSGLHRQTSSGIVIIIYAVLRVLLTILALRWKPDLESFFWAQIFAALMQTIALRYLLWRELALPHHKPRIRVTIIRSSLRFASGVTGIMITGTILWQADRVILSKLLNLSDFGIYSIAATLAMGSFMVVVPLSSIIFPRFSALIEQENKSQLVQLYHNSGQALSVMLIPLVAVIAGFSSQVLYVWTGNVILSQQGALILSFLIIGYACSAIMCIPSHLQVASGWIKLSFWGNVSAIIVLLPATWWAASRYGAVGGAAVWAIINLGSVIFIPQIMHRKLLIREKMRWYVYSVVLPVVISTAMIIVFRSIHYQYSSRVGKGISLFLYWLAITLVIILTMPTLHHLRRKIGSSILDKIKRMTH